jgi:hypothetical protein
MHPIYPTAERKERPSLQAPRVRSRSLRVLLQRPRLSRPPADLFEPAGYVAALTQPRRAARALAQADLLDAPGWVLEPYRPYLGTLHASQHADVRAFALRLAEALA